MNNPVPRPQPVPDLSAVLALAAGGDADAWRRLVSLYARRVYALVRSRCASHDAAEEVTQSVFCTLAQKLRQPGTGSYSEQGRFEAWLFRIAANRARDEARRSRRHAAPTDPSVLTSHADAASSPPSITPLPASLEELRAAMSSLSPADREIVELRHHAGLNFAQIAEILEEPLGTLLARHHRALRKLRSLLESPSRTHEGTQPEGVLE